MDPQIGDGTTDRAVSPVLGVVLMVAVTVILATVATAALQQTVTDAEVDAPVGAAVDIDDGAGVTVTWISNMRAEKLRVEFETDGDRAKVYLRRVGSVVTFDPDGFETSGGRVVVGEDLRVDRGDDVSVTVTAIRGEQRTQVVRRTARV